MTRREIIKRTGQYLFIYFSCILFAGALLSVIYYKKELQNESLILMILIFVFNMGFYYRYLYDVQNKNICEATIIQLCSDGKRRMLDILGRTIDGTTVGRNKRTIFLKPKRKTDYVFRTRGEVPGYINSDETIKIKYLKYSKIIIESELIEEKTMWLYQYSKKDKDYLLSPLFFSIKSHSMTMEEAKELTKEGNIKHTTYSLKERVERIIGGIIYSILVGPLIFIYVLVI